MGKHRHQTEENESTPPVIPVQSTVLASTHMSIDTSHANDNIKLEKEAKKKSSKKRKHRDTDVEDQNDNTVTSTVVVNSMNGGDRVDDSDGTHHIDNTHSDGNVENERERTTKKKKKDKESKKEKKKHKHKHEEDRQDAEHINDTAIEALPSSTTATSNGLHDENGNDNTDDILSTLKKAKPQDTIPLKGVTSVSASSTSTADHHNNQTTIDKTNITRLFVGNLPFQATDDDIYKEFDRKNTGSVVGLHWVTDKQSALFYGTLMIDFNDSNAANEALRMNGKDLYGRKLKVGTASGTSKGDQRRYNSKPKAGTKVIQISAATELSAKPEGCHTVFLGNLSFEIDDDTITSMFKDCGTITDLRWVEKDGVFKGCGFIEFQEDDAVDKAVLLTGQNVLGRKMRVDYAPNK